MGVDRSALGGRCRSESHVTEAGVVTVTTPFQPLRDFGPDSGAASAGRMNPKCMAWRWRLEVPSSSEFQISRRLRWGTADAEINACRVLSSESPEFKRFLFIQAWNMPTDGFECSVYCQEFCPDLNFPGTFNFIFSELFSSVN